MILGQVAHTRESAPTPTPHVNSATQQQPQPALTPTLMLESANAIPADHPYSDAVAFAFSCGSLILGQVAHTRDPASTPPPCPTANAPPLSYHADAPPPSRLPSV